MSNVVAFTGRNPRFEMRNNIAFFAICLMVMCMYGFVLGYLYSLPIHVPASTQMFVIFGLGGLMLAKLNFLRIMMVPWMKRAFYPFSIAIIICFGGIIASQMI